MLTWHNFIEALGHSKASAEFISLSQEFNELPVFDEGVLGDRNYYLFFQSGILFLLEDDQVDQISFYIEADQGFSVYKGELPVPSNATESEVIQLLGPPSSLGGGKMDILMGYFDRWVKYENDTYALHLQFSQNDKLCRATLMKLNNPGH